jgi:hypothetical protein
MKKTMMAALIVAGAVAVPMVARAQQVDTTKHQAVTPKNVAKNTDEEAERVGKRTSKVVKKGAKDTAKQAKRTAKGAKKVYSRKARQEANGEKAKKDSVKAATHP